MSETANTNTIIREHGNMLDVSINGKFQTVPKCTCGIDFRFPGAQQFSNQPVAAGVCPVYLQFLLIQEICNRPGIINVCYRAEGKSVIPSFYILPVLLCKPLILQRLEDFFLRKEHARNNILA